MLPNFILCGAQKAGTTTLFNYLDQHPDICTPRGKEVHFFDWDSRYNMGLNWYETQFDNCDNNKVIGEASPYYMFLPKVPKRIKKDLEDVKLIFILRDPIDRAYSHYWHEVKKGWETLSFEEAIKKEPKRIRRNPIYLNHYSYLERGKFVIQLDRFSRYFSKDKLFILTLEELIENKNKTLTRLFEYLDVNSDYKPQKNKHKNKGGAPRIWSLQKIAHRKNPFKIPIWKRPIDSYIKRKINQLGIVIGSLIDRINLRNSYPSLDKKTRSILNNYFVEYNEKLFEKYGVDYV